MQIPDDTELSPALACELLGVPLWTLRTLIAQGKIDARRTDGGHRRVTAGAIAAYLESQEQS